MSEHETELYTGWAILELMGHRKLAGKVSFTMGLLRIDIPCAPPVTQFYGVPAIYCLTPTTEEIARGLAARVRSEPVSRYELPPATTQPPVCSTCSRDIDPGEPIIYLGGGKVRCDECQAALDDKSFEKAQEELLGSPGDGGSDPPDTGDTPECSCGEPTCLGSCGQPPVTNAPIVSP